MPPDKEIGEGMLGNLGRVQLKESIEVLLVLNLNGFEIVQTESALSFIMIS
jgi:hypothetical protein